MLQCGAPKTLMTGTLFFQVFYQRHLNCKGLSIKNNSKLSGRWLKIAPDKNKCYGSLNCYSRLTIVFNTCKQQAPGINNSQNRGNQVQTDQMHPTAVQPKSVQPGGNFALPAWLPTWLRPKKNLPPLTWQDFILLPVFFLLFIFGMDYIFKDPNDEKFFLAELFFLAVMFIYRKGTSWRELLCLFFVGLFAIHFFTYLAILFSFFPGEEIFFCLIFSPFLVLRVLRIIGSNIYFLFSYSVFLILLSFILMCLMAS